VLFVHDCTPFDQGHLVKSIPYNSIKAFEKLNNPEAHREKVKDKVSHHLKSYEHIIEKSVIEFRGRVKTEKLTLGKHPESQLF